MVVLEASTHYGRAAQTGRVRLSTLVRVTADTKPEQADRSPSSSPHGVGRTAGPGPFRQTPVSRAS